MKTISRKTIGIGLLVMGLVFNNSEVANAQLDNKNIDNMPVAPGGLKHPNITGVLSDLKSKEVSVEVNAGRGADVYIENTSRTIEIKAWNEPKVKVVTTIYYEGDASKLSDEEWFEKLNLNVKSLGNSVRIKSGTVSSGGSFEVMGNTYSWSSGPASGTAIFNSEGESVGSKSNVKRLVTIYLPKENKLDIESKYADITVDDNLNKVVADITNGNLDVQDVNNFTLRSKYANVSTGNLQTGIVEFINGHFSAKEVGEIDLDTKYSTVDIASANKIDLVSTNDDYDIEEVGNIQGQKNYGNLRISKLNKSIEMDGTNADIKVRNISSSVETIKFDNKYADIRLPLRNVKNYTINYIGAYSTVYGNFEKKPYTGKAFKTSSSVKETLDEKMQAMNESLNGGDETNSNKFSASVGDGKGAEIDMRCQNCTVDFK
jgi:hypothetical protein